MPSSHAVAKSELRELLLTARRRRGPTGLATADRARTAHLLAAPEVRDAAVVAAYVSVGTEPGTDALVTALHARGTRVLLPVLLPDGDLDWAAYDGPASLVAAGRGLREPTSPRLGRAAVADADLVVVPGLAVDGAGHRLGRGGGSYDRALARVGAGTPAWVLLGADELDRPVPVEPHDVAVAAAVTEAGVRRFGVAPG